MLAASARVQMTRLSVDVGTDARSAGRREYFEAIQMRARRPQRRERAGLKGLAGADAPRELRPLESESEVESPCRNFVYPGFFELFCENKGASALGF